MPNLFSFGNRENENALAREKEAGGDERPARRPHRASSLMRGFGNLWKRQHQETEPFPPFEDAGTHQKGANGSLAPPDSDAQRKALPSLPRRQTFLRQQSEQRNRLLAVADKEERRTLSVDRRRGLSETGPRPMWWAKDEANPRVSLPEFKRKSGQLRIEDIASSHKDLMGVGDHLPIVPALKTTEPLEELRKEPEGTEEDLFDHGSLQEDCDRRWVLNLSMNFRDKSHREKFFVTYADAMNKWRRLTISLDYRNAPEGSLEADLSRLSYQREKSLRIYEAIRESLPDIQYYDTVTNLKLETTPEDGQLHVHVREDGNEIIHYPEMSLFGHIRVPRYTEHELQFISHLSGFVYKVQVGNSVLIKKEIPGPDTVDEFLYEVNALDSLTDSRHVIRLEGLVTTDDSTAIKGLLISYASQGALIDVLYDFRNTPELPWSRREKWARQIIEGLSDIHEAGFVQGDFTLSNVVIDTDDSAQIIDINRRGCPVGWEPPELSRLIDSGQRIGMCIGVKTDLFQLGMVLWALAEEVDEPERVERPLPPVLDSIPAYYRRIVDTCLSPRPQGRIPAARLLRLFPRAFDRASRTPSTSSRARLPSPSSQTSRSSTPPSSARRRGYKEYIDPDMAITLSDVRSRSPHSHPYHDRRSRRDTDAFTSGQVTYVDPSGPVLAFDDALVSAGDGPKGKVAAPFSDSEMDDRASRGSWERVERWDLGRGSGISGRGIPAVANAEPPWERGRSPGLSSLQRRGSSFRPASPEGEAGLGDDDGDCGGDDAASLYSTAPGERRTRAGSEASAGGRSVVDEAVEKAKPDPKDEDASERAHAGAAPSEHSTVGGAERERSPSLYISMESVYQTATANRPAPPTDDAQANDASQPTQPPPATDVPAEHPTPLDHTAPADSTIPVANSLPVTSPTAAEAEPESNKDRAEKASAIEPVPP